jgi:hypothetical protein
VRNKDQGKSFPSAISTTFKCAWCDDEIGEDVELFTVGATANPEIDLVASRGKTIPLLLEQAQKTIDVLVPTSDSRAAKEGIDLLFTVCSLSCAQALTNTLSNELNLVGKANLL